jgi:hypothetical protein
MNDLAFSSQDILNELESATQPVKDSAQFGIVQMHPDGVVAYYNPWEAARAGLSAEKVFGRHFFRQDGRNSVRCKLTQEPDGEKMPPTAPKPGP